MSFVKWREAIFLKNSGQHTRIGFRSCHSHTMEADVLSVLSEKKSSTRRDFCTPNNNENRCKACMRKYFKLRKNRKCCPPFSHGSCNIVPDTIDTINSLSQRECFLSKSFVKPKFENVLPTDFTLVIKKVMTWDGN